MKSNFFLFFFGRGGGGGDFQVLTIFSTEKI